jgi:hypothetical protein
MNQVREMKKVFYDFFAQVAVIFATHTYAKFKTLYNNNMLPPTWSGGLSNPSSGPLPRRGDSAKSRLDPASGCTLS